MHTTEYSWVFNDFQIDSKHEEEDTVWECDSCDKFKDVAELFFERSALMEVNFIDQDF